MTSARAGRSLSRGWIVGLAVGGLTALVFSRSVGYGFVAWDDEVLLAKNSAFRGFGWGALRWIASSYFGNWLAGQGLLARAIGHYERALELDPRRVELHTNVGLALVRLRRPAEAVPRYERVLAQRPALVPVRVSLATALVAAERLPEAVLRLDEAARFSTPAALVEYFQRLTAAEPAASVPRRGLFQAYARVGDPVRAREAWEALAGLQPALARASLGDGPGAGVPLRP